MTPRREPIAKITSTWQSPALLESLEPRLMLDGTAPIFDAPLREGFVVPADGSGYTIGVDGYDADGDALTLAAVSDSPDLNIFIPTGNRYAVLHFVESDGVTPIGDVLVQLFEGRAPEATDRFITLATNHVEPDGTLVPGGEPFYNGSLGHRIIQDFMVQTGDADGVGDSPLDDLVDNFDPTLAFPSPGAVAYANSGADTSNCQFFVTEEDASWLNFGYYIFGQLIDGREILNLLSEVPVDETNNHLPYDPPILHSVDIIESPQDGTITFWAGAGFSGVAHVTVSLDDGNGNVTQDVITLLAEDAVGTPSVLDVYMLELINRARANPQAEVERYGPEYWEGTPDLNEGLDPGTITADPKAPLAFNTSLIAAAQQHSQYLVDNDRKEDLHTGLDGTDEGTRMWEAGYPFEEPWDYAELIGQIQDVPEAELAAFLDEIQRDLFTDADEPGRWNRVIMLHEVPREIGIGTVYGEFLAADGVVYDTVMVVEDYALSGNYDYLTGVAYDDLRVLADKFFTPGEECGGITIEAVSQADAATYSTTTWYSGGYTLGLPPGTYDVTASGDGFETVTVNDVVIGEANVKLDFPGNYAPVPVDAVFNVDEDAAHDGTLVATDRNAGDPLVYTIHTHPAHGTIAAFDPSTGEFTYEPEADYFGDDSFTFTANDTHVDSDTAGTMAITVDPTNDAPVADDGAFHVTEDGIYSGSVTAGDIDPGDVLTYAVQTAPTHGTLTAFNTVTGAFVYKPDADYAGPDSFTFVANDTQADSNEATVTIAVDGVNDAPVAQADAFHVDAGGAYAGQVVATDVDAGDTLIYVIWAAPLHGALTGLDPLTGAFTYEPTAGYEGPDRFTFRANDTQVSSNVALVTITVDHVNQAPVAQDGAFQVPEGSDHGGKLAASDLEGDALTYAIATGPAHGTITAFSAATGAFTYRPATNYEGPDSFTFIANDGQLDSNEAAVDIAVILPGEVQIGEGGVFSALYTDGDGTRGRIFLVNGSAMLGFQGQDLTQTPVPGGVQIGGTNVHLAIINVTASTASTSLIVSAAGGADGLVTLGTLIGTMPMGLFGGFAVDLIGAGIHMTGDGYIRTTYVHDVAADTHIVMPGTGAAGLMISAARMSAHTNVTLGSPLTMLIAREWLGGELHTPYAGTLLITGYAPAGVRGDFGADATFTAADFLGRSLLVLNVAGKILTCQIQAPAGSVGTVIADQWDDGLLEARTVTLVLTTGNRFDPAVDGRFGADIRLTGQNFAGTSMGSAIIAGEIACEWTFAGGVGTISAAATAATWILDVAEGLTGLFVRGDLAGALTAKYFGTVSARGNVSAAITATGASPRGYALLTGMAGGNITGGKWDLAGNVASVRAAATAAAWELAATGWVSSLSASTGLAGTIEALYINSLTTLGDFRAVVDLKGQNLAGTSLGVLLAGQVIGDVTLTAVGLINLISVWEWQVGRLQAGGVGTLLVLGNASPAIALDGHFGATVVLTGVGVPAWKSTLGTAIVRGNLFSDEWDILGDLGMLYVLGAVRGTAAAPVTVRTTGGMATLMAGTFEHAHFLAGIGAGAGEHAAVWADFANPAARIGAVTVRGVQPAGGAFMTDTNFSAARFGVLNIVNPDVAAEDVGLWCRDSDQNDECTVMIYRDTATGNVWVYSTLWGPPYAGPNWLFNIIPE